LPHRADAQPAPGSWPRFPSLFGLAPCGVYPASVITAGAVRSYRTFSPLPLRGAALWTSPSGTPLRRRYVFCGTSRPRDLKPASRTLSGTLPCGVRTFLPRQPLLSQGLPAATARSSCQCLVYRENVFARRAFARHAFAISEQPIRQPLKRRSRSKFAVAAAAVCLHLPLVGNHPMRVCLRGWAHVLRASWPANSKSDSDSTSDSRTSP
jgi:hypothetical protein